MLSTLLAAFCVLNLFATVLIFSACTLSSRESRMADAEQAAILQHMRIQSALERIRTVHATNPVAIQA